MAQSYVSTQQGQLVIHPPHPNPPLHLDRDKGWRQRKASDFDDTFVDLYLLALAGCVAFSKGGYGHWAVLIGDHLDCAISHEGNQRGGAKNKCRWHAPQESRKLPQDYDSTKLFLDPMP